KLVLVIEDFLNITRIELGRIKYDLTEWSFNTLVKNVIGEQKPNIERRGLSFSYDEDAPEYKVYADQGKVSQVISNLIDNSTKYTKEGSIAVKVSGVTDKDGKKGVRVTVKDTGVGVAPETMPHLFEKFSRAEDASKTNIIGTGLGLYVAKQIMDAHQGKIWAESEGKGKGSTFFVELALTTGVAPVPVIPPAEQDNNPTSPAIPAPVPVPQPETRHLT
ncbi:MAG: HAMP domain-containing sensor histidine kinase, partial [Candidatus Vogelbacteria bacterium]|nr:HAMP domain-containing sensor histidine kinase [Candidatus Vogelbacteria bacterium]